MNTDTASQPQQEAQPPARIPKSPVAIGTQGLVLHDLDSLWRFSTVVSTSGLAPKGIQTPEAVFVAVQMGLELGLTPMAALQNIAVINGRPSVWGDAQLAIVRGTGQLEILEEWFEQDGKRLPRNPSTYTDATAAVCRVKRRDDEPMEIGFSVADAKTAGLWGKEGPWRQYPFRMLRFRARSFALRDKFGDALKGILTAEEAGDIIDITPAKTVKVEAPNFLTQPAAYPSTSDTVKMQNPAPPPEPVNEVGVNQNRLAAFCAGEGASFDLFREALSDIGQLEGNDVNATAFADLSDKLCTRLLGARAGLKRALAAKKAHGGAK